MQTIVNYFFTGWKVSHGWNTEETRIIGRERTKSAEEGINIQASAFAKLWPDKP